MAKGKAKNSSDSLAPPQPRSLRSRKRECPSDEIPETDDVQATVHHQDIERNNTAMDATLLQSHQSLLQESTDPATEEKHAETTNVLVKTTEVQDLTTVTNPKNDSQLECITPHTDNEANHTGKDKQEITVEECNRSPSQTYTSQLQVLLPSSEEGNRSTALEEQLGAKENSQCNLKRNQETSHEEYSNVYMPDSKDVTKEAVAGLPAKKKRRMGMCGLTEKERSHFLQVQKRENGQNRPEKAKKICSNTADLLVQEEIISSPPLPFSLSIPAGSVTELNEAAITLRSSDCGGDDDRAETEVDITVKTSDGTSTVCDPGCSEGKSFEAEGGIVTAPQQTGDTTSDPPTEEELLGKPQQELEGCRSECMAEKPLQQMKDRGDGSAVGDQSHAISFYSGPMRNEETENQDAIEAAPLQVNSVTRTRDEKKEELVCDAGGGFNCSPVELSAAAVSPGGSKRKEESCDPDDEPGASPSTLNAEHPKTRVTTDPFGSGHLDFVSDSQLNTITLTEEEVMEREEDLGSPDCHDATDLICGLIRELSSLNRKVMSTHREVENLRRSNKSSRSSTR